MPKSFPMQWAVLASLAVIANAVFEADIADRLWVLSIVVTGIIWCFAAVIALSAALHAIKRPHSRRHMIAAAVVLVSCSATYILGSALSTKGRFLLLRPHYETLLAQALSGNAPKGSFQVEGRFIAFHWLTGVTDNWIGLVYDPDDSLELPGAEHIFGGDVTHVQRLSEKWFLCYFT